jgi:hypothetical protein
MATIRKTTASQDSDGTIATVEGNRSHANDPYVVKKVEQAKAFINKVGLPKTTK